MANNYKRSIKQNNTTTFQGNGFSKTTLVANNTVKPVGILNIFNKIQNIFK